VESRRKIGVTNGQWRMWMLQLTIFLQHQVWLKALRQMMIDTKTIPFFLSRMARLSMAYLSGKTIWTSVLMASRNAIFVTLYFMELAISYLKWPVGNAKKSILYKI